VLLLSRSLGSGVATAISSAATTPHPVRRRQSARTTAVVPSKQGAGLLSCPRSRGTTSPARPPTAGYIPHRTTRLDSNPETGVALQPPGNASRRDFEARLGKARHGETIEGRSDPALTSFGSRSTG
jgi:hypothetical protein